MGKSVLLREMITVYCKNCMEYISGQRAEFCKVVTGCL